VTEEEVISDCP